MTKEQKIRNILTEIDEAAVISAWNEFCYNTSRYDDEIIDAYRMEELMQESKEPLTWVNRFFFGHDDYDENGSANPNRNYFTFNGYGNIISFDYIYNQYKDEFSYIDDADLINYMIENSDALGIDEVEEVLQEEETTEE